jgi:hypothetical protein
MATAAVAGPLLSEELRESYARDGYLVLRQFVPADAIAVYFK